MCQTVACDVYEQIENVQGGQNREKNPEHCLLLKPTTQHLTNGGAGGGGVAQAITTVPWELCFVRWARLQHAKQKAWSH